MYAVKKAVRSVVIVQINSEDEYSNEPPEV
jgi:hypothetical protein